jgi:iron complex outermembrane receptor protein
MSIYHRFTLLPVAILSINLGLPLSVAYAQDESNTPTTQITIKNYSIPPQPLLDALIQFGRQTGLQISVEDTLIRDKKSQGIKGAFSIQQAVTELLHDTGLQYKIDDSMLIVFSAATGNNDTTLLNPVVVLDSLLHETATSKLPGYVATRSTTATKTDTAIIETPQSISVVSAKNMNDRKITSVEQAVSYTSGVRVGGSGLDLRFDQILVRGQSVTTTSDFLDGLRQPNTGWLAYFGTEPYNLERVEVLKGPSSVLYGQISPGGMVNRVSKRPTGEEQAEIQLQAGSHNHWQGQFDIAGVSANTDLSYRLVGLKRDADTEIDGINNDTDFIAPSVSWNISEKTNLTLLAQYQDRETSGSPRPYQDGSVLTDFWAGDEAFDKLDQQQYSLGYEFQHTFNDVVSFQQNLRYGDVNSVNQYLGSIVDSGDGHTLDRTAIGVYESMQALTTDTRLVFTLGEEHKQHTVIAGIDYIDLDYDVEYSYGAAPSIDMFDPDYNQNIARPMNVISKLTGHSEMYGTYLMDQIKIDNWRFSAGLRHDSIDNRNVNLLSNTITTTHNSHTSGSLGALYAFESGISPYISYAQSFLPQAGSDAYGNQYAPTTGEQIELGVKYASPARPILLVASIYQLTQNDLLTPDLDNVGFSIQTGEQKTQGIELEATADLTPQLSFTASYSFNDAEVTKSNSGNEGKEPNNSPRHLASLWANYEIAGGRLDGLGLSGGVRWVGSSYQDSLNTLKNDDYFITDLGMNYKLNMNGQNLILGLNVSNLFDKRYVNCVGNYCYRGEGSKIVGSLTYNW